MNFKVFVFVLVAVSVVFNGGDSCSVTSPTTTTTSTTTSTTTTTTTTTSSCSVALTGNAMASTDLGCTGTTCTIAEGDLQGTVVDIAPTLCAVGQVLTLLDSTGNILFTRNTVVTGDTINLLCSNSVMSSRYISADNTINTFSTGVATINCA